MDTGILTLRRSRIDACHCSTCLSALRNSILSFRPGIIERQAYSYVFRYSTCSLSVRLNKKSKCVIFTPGIRLLLLRSPISTPRNNAQLTCSIASVQAKEVQNVLELTSLAKSSWSRSPGSLLNSPRHCQHRMTTLDSLPIQSW
jgi:hypothetical protein